MEPEKTPIIIEISPLTLDILKGLKERRDKAVTEANKIEAQINLTISVYIEAKGTVFASGQKYTYDLEKAEITL